MTNHRDLSCAIVNLKVWSHSISVPNRSTIVLARVNNLFEVFGNRIYPETAQELEKGLGACVPAPTGTGINQTLNIGIAMV
ncbi:hypothetical protein RSAG8_13457, partial [Rhizoctonia solani AG-8 WAC10335]